MRGILVFLAVLTFASSFGQTSDTFEVHFPLNVYQLSKYSTKYIDDLIFTDKVVHGEKLIVLGYTDFVGGNGYNDTLSLKRASEVRNYLISSGFEKTDIKLCIGKGKINRTNEKGKAGFAPDRKVQIIIDRIAMAQKPKPDTTPKAAGDDADWSKLEVDQVFRLNNIYFKLNSPVILEKSQPDLQRLLNFLNHYPNVHIQIEGHVCCMGVTEGVDSRYKGRNLSECRAEAIYNFLVEKGVNKDRLKYVGLANRNPIVRDEVTEQDRQKNRRVEIRILAK